MSRDRSWIWGIVFGFVLSRIGATDPRAIHGMFTLTDPQLLVVIALAIAITAVVFFGFRRGRFTTRSGAPAALSPKPWQRGLVVGGLLFGVGWAVSGACPGTALTQIGEGRLSGALTFLGILVGAELVRRVTRRKASSPAPVSAPPAGEAKLAAST
ncbi:MAG TPA: DUF6691 family protein [Polyangiaceae bacterium]|nr:DUF6691 family protein [Polyangiaceae bacterium]